MTLKRRKTMDIMNIAVVAVMVFTCIMINPHLKASNVKKVASESVEEADEETEEEEEVSN